MTQPPLILLSLQTFFTDSRAQRKELAILKELCLGHFSHDNLCTVLDVSTDAAPIHNFRGKSYDLTVLQYWRSRDLY